MCIIATSEQLSSLLFVHNSVPMIARYPWSEPLMYAFRINSHLRKPWCATYLLHFVEPKRYWHKISCLALLNRIHSLVFFFWLFWFHSASATWAHTKLAHIEGGERGGCTITTVYNRSLSKGSPTCNLKSALHHLSTLINTLQSPGILIYRFGSTVSLISNCKNIYTRRKKGFPKGPIWARAPSYLSCLYFWVDWTRHRALIKL